MFLALSLHHQSRISTPRAALKEGFYFIDSNGDVRKTTSIFFTIKEVAKKFSKEKILIIDASLYVNLTRVLSGEASHGTSTSLGTTLSAKGCAIKDTCFAWGNPEAGIFSFFGRNMTLHSNIGNVRQSERQVPRNISLMTIKSHSKNDGILKGMISFNDESISRVCNRFRRVLDKNAQKDKESDGWEVSIDTNWGIHYLTHVDIKMTDGLIIPLSAVMNAWMDALRLIVAFGEARRFYDKELSKSTVDNARNIWRESPFTPHTLIQNIMKAMKVLSDEWSVGMYKKTLVPLTKPFEDWNDQGR